jgi:hypothetical protein
MGRPGPSGVGARASTVLLACIGSALVLGVVAPFAAGPAPSFARQVSYRAGVSPSSVAIADLNGDGKPELVTADYGEPSRASVFLNRGDGRFQAKRDHVTGPQPISLAIGDLNGDGKPDLATANLRGLTVSVLLNRGDGSFEPKRDFRTGTRPLSVAIGDLTGDGKPEIVTSNAYLAAKQNRNPGTVSVLVNRGDGSFEPKVDHPTGKFPWSVALRDLNGDGKLDLATANLNASTASVFLNRGDGSFETRRDYRTGRGPRSLAVDDLDDDGDPDLATAGRDYAVSTLVNTGGGSFRRGHSYGQGSDSASIAIGDVTGNGKPDLATANESPGAVSLFANRGRGFAEKLDYPTGKSPSVAIGDLNGDGRLDIASANFIADTVSVLLNRPGLCTVQSVLELSLAAAKRALARANCSVGKIRRMRRIPWQSVPKGYVTEQRPRFGAVLPGGGKVNLVLSGGRTKR